MNRRFILILCSFFVLSACSPTNEPVQPNFSDDGGVVISGDSSVALPALSGIDSDGDTIDDSHEFAMQKRDSDGDGIPDSEDDDSDNDMISDADEAGDADSETPPIDSDGDGIPDFVDPDSDNDGISDLDEFTLYMSSPISADTDGDGATDLIEIGAGTNPSDAKENPQSRGDFLFVSPYQQTPTPERDTLLFKPNVQIADLYILFDETNSMRGEISAMRSAMQQTIEELSCTGSAMACTGADGECLAGEVCGVAGKCIKDPSVSACIADLQSGTGSYAKGYWHRQSIQSDPTVTAAGFPTRVGGRNEYLTLALHCIAHPESARCSGSGCATAGVGCPGYRPDAIKIVLAATDENNDYSSVSLQQAGMELKSAGIKLIGVNTHKDSKSTLETLGRESGTVDAAGSPIVVAGSNAAIVPALKDGVVSLVRGVPLRMTVQITDEPGDDGDSLSLIERIVVNTTREGCANVGSEDTDNDGFDDAYPAVLSGTPVCWDLIPAINETLQPKGSPQVFRARLTVLGDGSPLDSRVVHFLVPPTITIPLLQ